MKKEPERTCVGCGRKGAPETLDRIAHRPDGTIAVGRSEPGRGAWLCRGSLDCFRDAERRHRLQRALRHPLENGEIDALRARLYGRLHGRNDERR